MHKTILIAIDQLELGGAGRVCSLLANGLVDRGYDVAVCTAIQHHAVNYQLSEKITIKEWYDPEPVKHNVFGKIYNMFNRFKYYRRALKEVRPDVVIAFTHNMFFYVKMWSIGYGMPILASDHTSMGRDLGKFTNFIRHHYYAKADAVTILTEKDAKLLGNKLPNKKVLYNPNTFDILRQETPRQKTILCVGRKDYWKVKGFDIMLNIWSRIESRHKDWRLSIVGPGKDGEEYLWEMSRSLGIEDRVTFVGNVLDMESLYQSVEIFALSSRVEGFPVVLLEAMSQGCACISFSMQGAIAEIIKQGEDGDIVEDGNIDAFADKLEELMNDADKRKRYSVVARQNIARFSRESFVDKWETIIRDVIK